MIEAIKKEKQIDKDVELSIIIVSWNAKKYLEKCLNSILADKDGAVAEIIVVDNSSTDGSQEMVKNRFPSVCLIQNQENYGFAKANNIGIRRATGKYICLVNSDVEIHTGVFRELIKGIEAEEHIGMVGPKIVGVNGMVQRSTMGFPTLLNILFCALFLDKLFPHSRFFGSYMMTYWKHDSKRAVDIINGCFWLVKKKALETVGLLDEDFFMYGEDMDWCKRFWKNGWKVVFIPTASVLHYGGASSANAPVRFYVEMNRANLKYWRKHHGLLSQCGYRMILLLRYLNWMLAHSILSLTGKNTALSRFKVKASIATIKYLVTSWE